MSQECILRVGPNDQKDPYVALSFVWGGTKGVSLTTRNEKKLAVPGALRNGVRPKTFSDAVCITRAIGFRYLWIDRMCIPEDGDKERHAQISAMDQIYGEASIVLVAAIGSSAHFGLYPRSVVLEPVGGCLLRYRLESELYYGFEVSGATYLTRGWTLRFQEQFLARRAIYCEFESLSAKCRGKPITFTVEGFSKRQLTYEADIQRAFAGLSSVFAQHSQHASFHKLPSALLLYCLFWHPSRRNEGFTSSDAVSPAQAPARRKGPFPSYSWFFHPHP